MTCPDHLSTGCLTGGNYDSVPLINLHVMVESIPLVFNLYHFVRRTAELVRLILIVCFLIRDEAMPKVTAVVNVFKVELGHSRILFSFYPFVALAVVKHLFAGFPKQEHLDICCITDRNAKSSVSY